MDETFDVLWQFTYVSTILPKKILASLDILHTVRCDIFGVAERISLEKKWLNDQGANGAQENQKSVISDLIHLGY